MGRVYELNLADLQKDEDQAFRKIKLKCEEIAGRNCLTNFVGMDMTRDKLCSLVRKWQSVIEAFVDVKTADGYVVRMFCIAFTKKRQNQIKKTCYAQSAQERQVRMDTRHNSFCCVCWIVVVHAYTMPGGCTHFISLEVVACY